MAESPVTEESAEGLPRKPASTRTSAVGTPEEAAPQQETGLLGFLQAFLSMLGINFAPQSNQLGEQPAVNNETGPPAPAAADVPAPAHNVGTGAPAASAEPVVAAAVQPAAGPVKPVGLTPEQTTMNAEFGAQVRTAVETTRDGLTPAQHAMNAEFGSQLRGAIREATAEEIQATRKRIQINTYGQDDINAYKAVRSEQGLDISDKLMQVQEDRRHAIQNAYGLVRGGSGDDSRISPESRRTEALRVMDEYASRERALEGQLSQVAPITNTSAKELVDTSRRAKLAEASMKADSDVRPRIAFDEQANLTVTVPQGADGSDVTISRMKGSKYYTMEIAPRTLGNPDFTPVRVDNLSLDDIDRMTVRHSGEGVMNIVVKDAKGKGINLHVVDQDDQALALSDKNMVRIEGAALNNERAPERRMPTEQELAARHAREEAEREQRQIQYRQQQLADAEYHARLRELNSRGREEGRRTGRSGGGGRPNFYRGTEGGTRGRVSGYRGRENFQANAGSQDQQFKDLLGGENITTQVAFAGSLDKTPEGGYKPDGGPDISDKGGPTRNA